MLSAVLTSFLDNVDNLLAEEVEFTDEKNWKFLCSKSSEIFNHTPPAPEEEYYKYFARLQYYMHNILYSLYSPASCHIFLSLGNIPFSIILKI